MYYHHQHAGDKVEGKDTHTDTPTYLTSLEEGFCTDIHTLVQAPSSPSSHNACSLSGDSRNVILSTDKHKRTHTHTHTHTNTLTHTHTLL